MSEEQRDVCAEILAGPRSKLPAPARVWLRKPELARKAQALGAYARYGTCLPRHLSELAILVTARYWSSEYEWFAHKTEALAAGVSPTIIDVIERGERPDFSDPQSACVYKLVDELYRTRTVSIGTYREGADLIGEEGLIDLVTIAGYYSLVAMTLNVFDIGVPEGAPRPFNRHQEAEDDV